ncbi:MAG: 6-carboxytetrahydropterin synthase [Chroococcales cyanobacterium]
MSMIYITRRVTFCASHRLHSDALSDEENRRVFGKCNNPNGHGHNYALKVTVRGEVNPKTGIVFNFFDLQDAIDAAIINEVDHKHINLDVPAFKGINPTAENMVVVFWNMLEPKLPPGLLYEMQLYETDNDCVTYRGT